MAEVELKIAPFSGHSAFEKEITELLVDATDTFKELILRTSYFINR